VQNQCRDGNCGFECPIIEGKGMPNPLESHARHLAVNQVDFLRQGEQLLVSLPEELDLGLGAPFTVQPYGFSNLVRGFAGVAGAKTDKVLAESLVRKSLVLRESPSASVVRANVKQAGRDIVVPAQRLELRIKQRIVMRNIRVLHARVK
jgi:hypothetical protein